MRVAFNEVSSNDVLAVQLGGTACNYVYDKATQIWPGSEGRVASVKLAVSITGGTKRFDLEAEHMYYLHSVHRLQKVAVAASNYMQVTMKSGLKYHLLKTYNGTVVATPSMSSDGYLVVTFARGTGPVASSLAVGEEVDLQLVTPAFSEAEFAATASNYGMKYYDLPHIPGIVYTWKNTTTSTPTAASGTTAGLQHMAAADKTSIGSRIFSVTLKDTRAKTTMTDKVAYTTANTSRLTVTRNSATENPVYARPYILLMMTDQSYGSVSAASVVLTYPAFTKIIKMKITAITKE